jgi:hypothetical protein
VQEQERWGLSHPHHGALPLNSGPQENQGCKSKAPWRRKWEAWVEKSCWPKHLGDAGAKEQKEEKPQQRWFFSGEWESQEGRQPGKKGGKQIRKIEEIISSASRGVGKVMYPGSRGPSHSSTKSKASLTRPQNT